MTPPKGKDFLRKIDLVLEREKNWVRTLFSSPLLPLSQDILWKLLCLQYILMFFKSLCSQVWWKRDGCPPFEKQPLEKKTVQDGSKKRYAYNFLWRFIYLFIFMITNSVRFQWFLQGIFRRIERNINLFFKIHVSIPQLSI